MMAGFISGFFVWGEASSLLVEFGLALSEVFVVLWSFAVASLVVFKGFSFYMFCLVALRFVLDLKACSDRLRTGSATQCMVLLAV